MCVCIREVGRVREEEIVHAETCPIILVSWLENQPTFNIKSAGSLKSMRLDNSTPSAGWCPGRNGSRETMVGGGVRSWVTVPN